MNTNTKETAFSNMFLLMTAMPGVKLGDRKGIVELAMAAKDFDEKTFRLNIDLSDEQLLATGTTTQRGGSSDWWIKEYRIGQSVACALDLEVHFEDDTQTQRVIGVDCETSRVLTVNGLVYQLGQRLVAPIEVAYESEPVGKLQINAERLVDDAELAKKYVDRRHEDAMQFFKSLTWTTAKTFNFCVQTEVYGVRIVHELKERMLHASPFWGELFFINQEDRDPILFKTFDNFVAYMLAKYW